MTSTTPQDQKSVEQSLQKENKALRNEIKEAQTKLRAAQSDLGKSETIKGKLEALCRELQKQNKFIENAGSSKISEAAERGKELAQEINDNKGVVKNITDNLAALSAESVKVRKENEELSKKLAVLQDYYEKREKILKDALAEAKGSLDAANVQLSEFQEKSAKEKEQILKEMQQLQSTLRQSKEHIVEAKHTEEELRKMVHNYDSKFTGLQNALKVTNNAYNDFKSEMEKVTGRTKNLEQDTLAWQKRWEESNTALKLMSQSHEKIKTELGKSHESLETMANLCRTLQAERKQLMDTK